MKKILSYLFAVTILLGFIFNNVSFAYADDINQNDSSFTKRADNDLFRLLINSNGSSSFVNEYTDSKGTPYDDDGDGVGNLYLNPLKVTYNGNNNDGGFVPIDSNEYEFGCSTYVLDNVSNLSKEGKLFKGWSENPNDITPTYFPNDVLLVDHAVTLYAVWGDFGIVASEKIIYEKDDTLDLDIQTDGPSNLIDYVELDENKISSSDYNISLDPAIVTLNKDYLNQLDVGDHTLKIVYTDSHISSTKFEIVGSGDIDYLSFTATSNNSKVHFYKENNPDEIYLQYKINDNWIDYEIGEYISLPNIGDKVYFRAKSNITTNFSKYDNYYRFGINGNVEADGDLTTLINRYGTTKLIDDYCFEHLFQFASQLLKAPRLPATTLTEGCYYLLFDWCTNLKEPPELPAMVMRPYCYSSMFSRCEKLTKPSLLPATTLADYCYHYMFSECGFAISDVQDEDYTFSYNFPSSDNIALIGNHSLTSMFRECGGGVPFIDNDEGTPSLTNGSTTLYLKTFHLTYNGNNCDSGEPPVDNNRYLTHETVISSTDIGTLSKHGYFISYWSTSPEGDGKKIYPGSPFDIDESTKVLYAIWEENYEFVEGFNQTHEKNLEGNLKFTYKGNSNSNEYIFQVDGKAIIKYTDCDFYTGGPYIYITLKSDFLNSLDVGKHTLTLSYKNGQKPSIEFEILQIDTKNDYLNFTFKGNGSYFYLAQKNISPSFSLEYRVNNKEWENFIIGKKYYPTDGDKIYIRNKSNTTTSFSTSLSNYLYFEFGKSLEVECDGDITTLINKNGTKDLGSDFVFCNLFKDCTSLLTAPNLPATTITNSCYRSMFWGCINLTEVSDLPAVYLKPYCYYEMFYNCKKICEPMQLPATNLADSCYRRMFYQCHNLQSAPNLPATVLAPNCYDSMFYSCTSIVNAPDLPATILAEYCYQNMFYYCTAMETFPNLPSTTLASYCYNNMFSNCTKLKEAPELPAMSLEDYCYYGMFSNCKDLEKAPNLPSLVMKDFCYSSMFSGCSNLNELPELPSMQLANGCYQNMFSCCYSIEEAPLLPALNLAESCYYGMFSECDNIINSPDLPALNLAESCYCSMFCGCDSLCTAPNLPALNLADSCYNSMFSDCANLINAPDLPANQLGTYCYASMFAGCISLKVAPDLPALELKEGCYSNMFSYCEGLENAPKIFATSLAPYSCDSMFVDCHSLQEAPDLPALNLSECCYQNMFAYCTELKYAPELPATVLAPFCYSSMFAGCYKLLKAPDLPALCLENCCYSSMFSDCESLMNPPKIYGLNLENVDMDCFGWMFSGCNKFNISDIQDEDYSILYKLPYEGSLVYNNDFSDYAYGMFYNAGENEFVYDRDGTPNDEDGDGIINLYLKPYSVNIFYRGNNNDLGSVPIDTDEHIYNDEVTVLPNSGNLLKRDKVFKGWGISPSATSPDYLPGDKIVLKDSIYLYAIYGDYEIINDDDDIKIEYEQNTPYGPEIETDGPSFGLSVKVDETELTLNEQYSITSDPTIVTLSPSYLNTLNPGLHTLYLIYANDQVISTTFTIYPPSIVDYLCFTAKQDDSSIYLHKNDNVNDIELQCKINDGRWINYVIEDIIILDNNDKLYFRNKSVDTVEFNNPNGFYNFIMTGLFEGSGDVTTLINKNGTNTLIGSHTFYNLFLDCSPLISAPMLNAVNLTDSCYLRMFYNSGITVAPELPASELKINCYSYMFRDCTSLLSACELPAQTLTSSCYSWMFSGCTSLVSPPLLPAFSLADSCYKYMFNGCVSLKYIPSLPALALESQCYYGMFNDCTSLSVSDVAFDNSVEHRIPFNGSIAYIGNDSLNSMFKGTNGDIDKNYNGIPQDNDSDGVYYVYIPTYMVNLVLDNNGSDSGELPEYQVQYSAGSVFYIPDTNTLLKSHNAFKGWNTRKDGSGDNYKPGDIFKIIYNTTLYANWGTYSFIDGEEQMYHKKSLVNLKFRCDGPLNELESVRVDGHILNDEYFDVVSGSTCITLKGSYLDTLNIDEHLLEIVYKDGQTPSINFSVLDSDTTDYLCFKALEDQSSIALSSDSSLDPLLLEYRKNFDNWQAYTFNTVIQLDKDDFVYFRNKNEETTKFNTNYHHFIMTGKIEVSGDITTLINKKGSSTLVGDNCFEGLFKDCQSLISAPKLNATTLTYGCYKQMFMNCISLLEAPKLPADDLSDSCYDSMFKNCDALLSTPDLNALNVKDNSYKSMFEDCDNLTTLSSLEANEVGDYGFSHMFVNCSKLEYIPTSIQALYLGSNCFESMFENCSSLKISPNLPALNLADGCYQNMFKNCTSLRRLPNLPAVNLPDNCYNGMFSGCSSIDISDSLDDYYSIPYYIPSNNVLLSSVGENSVSNMFASTGGPESFVTDKNGTPVYEDGDYNIVLYIKAIRINYFANTGIGSVPVDNNKYLYGDTAIIKTNTLFKKDQAFKGWNTSSDKTGAMYKPEQVITVEDNIALYAIWGDYEFIDDGSPRDYEEGSTNDIEFITDGPLEDFDVYLNNQLLQIDKQYKTSQNPTKVILLSSYVKTLPVGEYTLKVIYANGQVLTIKFSIKAKPVPHIDPSPYKPPKTGIN